jgi:hypothetical protein
MFRQSVRKSPAWCGEESNPGLFDGAIALNLTDRPGVVSQLAQHVSMVIQRFAMDDLDLLRIGQFISTCFTLGCIPETLRLFNQLFLGLNAP